jgi:hypothetical protein
MATLHPNSLSDKMSRTVKDNMRQSRQTKANLEPHVILHLRVSKKDIQNHAAHRIQTEPTAIHGLPLPSAYEPGGFSGFGGFGDIGGMGAGGAGFSNAFSPWQAGSGLAPIPQMPQVQPLQGPTHMSTPISSLPSFQETATNPPGQPQFKPQNDLSAYNLEIPHVSLNKHTDIPVASPEEETDSSDVRTKIIDAMCEFADANRRKEWPTSTSINCRWDSHPFNGPPVAIPRWYIKGVFYVMDNYCSWSCAAAHIFARNDLDESEKWECYSLLHLLRKQILKNPPVRKIELAPKLGVLKIHGGPHDILQYRNINKETNAHHKIYKINYPPMISIVPKIEEHTFKNDRSDMRLLQNSAGMRASGKMQYVAPRNEHYFARTRWGKDRPFIPVDQDRIEKAVQNLRIKRTKPLLDKKHTLLNYMNLKIKSRKDKGKSKTKVKSKQKTKA